MKNMMHPPFEAVRGHDRTFVQRMTPAEYVEELEEEEEELRGEINEREVDKANDYLSRRKRRQYELRRSALTSRDPSVVFSSTFPMYDRLGRELCVIYQIHDWDLQKERHRVRRGEADESRRSGVRLSDELQVNSLYSRVLSVSAKEAGANGDPLVARTTEECDTVDIWVSAMSRNSSCPRLRSVSAHASEFSICRDSSKMSALMAAVKNFDDLGEGAKIRTPVPPEPVWSAGAETETTSNLVRDGVEKPVYLSCSKDAMFGYPEKDNKENVVVDFGVNPGRVVRCAEDRWWSRMRKVSEHSRTSIDPATGSKRARSTPQLDEASPIERIYRQRRPDQMAARLDLPKRPVSSSPPPSATTPAHKFALQTLHSSYPQQDPTAPGYDPIRLTTVRDSVVPRITTQLFRATCGGAQAVASTAVLGYAQLIPSAAYGLQARTIPASKVHSIVEENYRSSTASRHVLESFPDTRTPELRCGLVIQLGQRWFQLCSLIVASEAYAVVEVHPPQPKHQDSESKERSGFPEAHTIHPPLAVGGQTGTSANTVCSSAPATVTVATMPSLNKARGGSLSQQKGAVNAWGVEHSIQGLYPSHVSASDVVCHPIHSDGRQTLLYQWRTKYLPFKGKESRRAALGLALAAPQVSVDGFEFADGGLTLVTIPSGYCAIPMSSLALTSASYITLLKAVLRLLSFMVARRIVHGNLTSVGELLLLQSLDVGGASGGGSALGNGSASTLPVVAPIHWERSLDFSMFVDRNAGRTIPYDTEDDTDHRLLTYGRDLETVLACFLEHRFSEELNSEQYLLLQRLIIMTREPTQVANFLVQIKNLMSTLSTDLAAVRQACSAALPFYSTDP